MRLSSRCSNKQTTERALCLQLAWARYGCFVDSVYTSYYTGRQCQQFVNASNPPVDSAATAAGRGRGSLLDLIQSDAKVLHVNPEVAIKAGKAMNANASAKSDHVRRLRIGLVEDDPSMRQKFARVIGRSGRFELWFESGSVQGALEWMSRCTAEDWPEIWLIDLGLPDGSGLTVIQQALGIHGPTLVLVISIFADDDAIMGALHAGAMGFIQKGDGDDELLQHLGHVTEGGAPISPRIAARLLESFKQSTHQSATSSPDTNTGNGEEAGSTLTARERAVLGCLTRGHSYEEAAEGLQMSINTFRHHIRGIYAKLGVHSRIDAINAARKRRWLHQP